MKQLIDNRKKHAKVSQYSLILLFFMAAMFIMPANAAYQLVLDPAVPVVNNTLTVTVLNSDKPESGILVQFILNGGTPILSITDSQGKSRFIPLVPGTLSIFATTMDGIPIANTSVTVITPDQTPTSIVVTSPNGGETWARGTTQTIRWTYSGTPGSRVKIELMKGSMVNRVINSSASVGSSGSGSYKWLINSSQTPGTDYKVRVTSTTNAAYTDTGNNNFTISGGIAVTSPNGGETWARGTTQTISWTYSGTPGSRVKIELMKGSMVNRIINSSALVGSSGSGSYKWLINSSQTPGTDYKVRVTSTTNAAYTDTGNNNFTIKS